MGRSSVDEVSTSGRTNESDSGGEGGLEQFLGFPGQVVSYPLGSDAFREFCKAKEAIGRKWEYRLSLPLTNLANGAMNAIGACLVQMNDNMWEVITVCDHLNDRWEREKKVRGITPEDVLQFYGVKNFKASGGSYFYASVTRRRLFDMNLAGRTWNDNIIWVKGNCLQRDDDELLDLRFRFVKQSVKSTVERKESLLDEVAKEGTELELVLGELGMSRKKRVEVGRKRLQRLNYLVDDGCRRRKKVARLVRRIWLGIEEQESELRKARLGYHLMLKGYSQEEVDAIEVDTYAEEEEEEAEVLGVMDGLDGVSSQTVLDNQGDDIELPEGGSEKVVKEMSLRINNLESGLARERETSKALLAVQAELQAISDLTRHVEEKDSGIKKGLEDLFEATEHAKNLQRWVDALAMKGKQADMAQYHIQALDQTEELCRSDLHKSRIDLEQMRKKFFRKDDEYWCDDLNERVARLKAERDQAISRAKKAEAREHSGGSKTVVKASLVQGDVVRLERLKARFATLIIPDVSRSALLSVIVSYYVVEVKRLESERDTLLKALSDKGCTCRAKIDRGNCLGAMETQLGPQTAKLVERGRVVMAYKMKDRPLDDVGESIVDTPLAEKNLL
ncbi:hypothetical protein GIB67_015485 [Kingdonia uniflora]|uniref:Uncharacterized protein n=1 Tax=Kingdonia uniflora TaxID=39325 RepID=A0A7J7LAE6_9MAGN|nr:hypothetical protein GIB67_015485 [Kingdonia uniflora]